MTNNYITEVVVSCYRSTVHFIERCCGVTREYHTSTEKCIYQVAYYYDLIIRCPACIADGGDGGPPLQWYHANCGGKIQIGDDANLKCTSCGHTKHIRHWRYAHGEHETDYRPTTPAHFASAISTAGQITSIAGREWLMRLLENLGDDW